MHSFIVGCEEVVFCWSFYCL